MVKKIQVIVVSVLCFFALTGCGQDDSLLNDPNAISIDVVNNTEDIIISHVLFYGTGLDQWGEDLLGDEVIEPGELYSFVLPEGSYTLIPMTYELYILPGARDISENSSIEMGGNGLVPILVINQTESDIFFLYLLESDMETVNDDLSLETSDGEDDINSLGEDILGDEILPSGLGRFFFIMPGVYDFIGFDHEGEVVLVDENVVIEGVATIIIE